MEERLKVEVRARQLQQAHQEEDDEFELHLGALASLDGPGDHRRSTWTGRAPNLYIRDHYTALSPRI